MKKILILSVLFAFFLLLSVRGQGVVFQDIPFEEALKAAQAEDKLIFMDCYTVWCIPCKVMAQQEFTKKEAGDYFNGRFINVKYDMEKGEGPALVERFNVTLYPTFLVIDKHGKERHRVVGASKINEFIAKVNMGIDESTSLSALDELYRQNKLQKIQYQNYIAALSASDRKSETEGLIGELWRKLSDAEKKSPDFFWIYQTPGAAKPASVYQNYLESNIADFKKKIDPQQLEKHFSDIYIPLIDSYIFGVVLEQNSYNPEELEALKQKINSLDLRQEQKYLLLCDLGRARCENNPADIVAVMEALLPVLDDGSYSKLLAAVHIVADKGTKEELERAVDVLEKAESAASREHTKELLAQYVKTYRRKTTRGIFFENVSFQEALKMAARENKLLFLDAYASWCGPCKKMDQEVFTQEKVGDFFNATFVNIKYDMEKGEGVELAKKYGVSAFPTYLLIRPDGILQHTFYGYQSAENFIAMAKKGLDANKSVNVQTLKYNAGNRTKAFLSRYAELLSEAGSDNAHVVARELFGTLSNREKKSPEYWHIYENVLPTKDGAPQLAFLMENIDEFYENIGRNRVDSTLSMMYRLKTLWSVNYDAYRLSLQDFEKMQQEVRRLDLPDAYFLIEFIELGKKALSGNKEAFLKNCEEQSRGKLSAELFPFIDLSNFVLNNATDSQKERWRKIGENLLLQMDEGRSKMFLNAFMAQKFS